MSAASGSRAKKLSFDNITPFGRPVVPLEYSWKATSSGPLGACRVVGSVGGDPLLVVLVLLVAADDEDRADRRQRVGDGVEDGHEVGSDDEHLGGGVVDDELDLWCGEPPVDVDADRVGRAAPKKTSKCSMPFLSRKAMRSWGPTPAAASPAATRLARSYNSDHDISRSPRTSAVLSGIASACDRRMSAMFETAIDRAYL